MRPFVGLLIAAAAFGCGCNVYDPSILEYDSVGSGASANGSGGGSGGINNVGGNSGTPTGGTGNASTGGGNGASGGSGGFAGISGTGGAGGDPMGGTGGVAATAGSDTGGTGGTAGTGVTGGTGGTGGSGGSGGTPPQPGDPDLIDNLADHNQFILRRSGRVGTWYGFGPPAFALEYAPPVADRPDMGAVHFTSAGFTATGGVGFSLNNSAGVPEPYNGSVYNAIRFFAKVGAGSYPTVRLAISDANTHPKGMLCSGTGVTACYDDPGVSVTLTQAWAEYTVLFEDMYGEGWGNGGELVEESMYEVQFKIMMTEEPVDLWVDDVSFIYE